MADITNINNSQISEVSLGDTINDWRTLTNDQIIAKLNLLNVYGIRAGIGLDVTGGYLGGGSGGTYDMAISDTIAKGITIDGNLLVTGSVSFSSAGEVSFPNGLVNVNGDDTPVAGSATAGIVVGSYTGPDFNSGISAPFLLNLGGSWFTNQNLKLIGGGVSADSSIQKIFLGEANGKTLSFSQTATDLVIGNGHTYDTVPVGTTLAGQIARIRSSDGRVDILKGVNKRRVSGISHAFSFGKVVRATDVDPTGFTLAIASGGATHAEVVGMISRINGDSDFEVTFNGEVEGNFSTVAGADLSVGCPYFLSAATPKGNITTTEPNTPGHVSKPVLVGLAADRGLFVNYRGQEVTSFASSGGGGGAGGTFSGRSIRMANPGYAVGDLIGMDDAGGYIKLNAANNGDQHRSRVLGLVVNPNELLLYGVTEPTDTFSLQSHVTNWTNEADTLMFIDSTNGSLTTTTQSIDVSPTALRLGASSQIFYFNTRAGQGYNIPSQGKLNTVDRDASAFTAAIVAGGVSGSSVGGGGYASSHISTGNNTILVNGGFDIWQRGIGVDSIHTGINNTYFADRWYKNKRTNFEQTFVVTASFGGFEIDGVNKPVLALRRGVRYIFDLSNAGPPTTHPFQLSVTEDGNHNSGSQYVAGWTTNGTQGQAGANAVFIVPADAPDTLWYYCPNHPGLGNSINVTDQGTDSTEIERGVFSEGQTKVSGNPKYYARVRENFTPGGGQTSGDFISYNNVIEDANTLAGQPAVLSFYARGATGSTGMLALEYTQYWQGTEGGTSSNQILPLIYLDGVYDWTRFAVNFSPQIGPTGSGLIDSDLSWAEISVLPYRFRGITGSTGAADVLYTGEVSLAKVQMESGYKVSDPSHVDINLEHDRCKRFYQTSYKTSDYTGKETMLGRSLSTPDEATPTIIMCSGSSSSSVRVPIEMRKFPTVVLYSPKGTRNMALNVSAGVDLNNAASSTGYNGAIRSWDSEARFAGTSESTRGFRLNSPFGWVFGDIISFHYVLNSEFNTGVSE